MTSNFNVGNNRPLQTVHTPATSPKTKTAGSGQDKHIQMKKNAPPKQQPINSKKQARLKKMQQRRTTPRMTVADVDKANKTLNKSAQFNASSGKELKGLVDKWMKGGKTDLDGMEKLSKDMVANMKSTRDTMIEIGGKVGMTREEVTDFIDGFGEGNLAKFTNMSVERLKLTQLRNEYKEMQSNQQYLGGLTDAVSRTVTFGLQGEIDKKEFDALAKDAAQLSRITVNNFDPNSFDGFDEESLDAPQTPPQPKKEAVEQKADRHEAPKTQKTPQKETIEAVFEDVEAPVETIIEKETAPKVKDSGDKPDKILESPENLPKSKTEAPSSNEKVRIGDDDQQRLMNEKKDSVDKATRQEPPKTDAPSSNEKVRIGDDDQQRLMNEKKDSVDKATRQETPRVDAPRTDEKVRIGDDDYRRQADERKDGADFAPRTALPLADRQSRLNEMEKQLLPLLTEYFKLMTGGADAPKGPAVERPPMPERKSMVKNAVGDVNASLRNPGISDQVKENAPAVPKAINTMVGGMNMPNPMQAMMAMFLVGVLSKLLGMDLSAFAQLGKMFPGGQGQNRN